MFNNLFSHKIYLAADHAGFSHKEEIKAWLIGEGKEVVDLGAESYDAEDDFPQYMAAAAKAVAKDPDNNCAIIFGGSGQGEAMTANRYRNVRATVYYGGSDEVIMLSRAHNDANILSLGSRFISVNDAKRVIWLWLSAPFGGEEKYSRRNGQLDKLK